MTQTSEHHSLTLREETILQQIVHQYISSANPVGSRMLAQQLSIEISPATIRNVMSGLEEKGYLDHPHTSAGRIPTDKGYRYYVDTMVSIQELDPSEKRAIESQLDHNADALDTLIRESTRILSRISRQLAIITSPQLGQERLRKLELVTLSSNRIMVVLSISSGMIKTLLFPIEEEVPSTTMQEIESFLNQQLNGLTLKEIRETFAERMKETTEQTPLIELFVQSSEKLFAENLDNYRLYIDGMRIVMHQPEFGDPNQLRNIIEMVENHNLIIHILNSVNEDDPITVKIGHEVNIDHFKEYSLVSTHYALGSMKGTVNIIGPRRMEYTRMVSLVDYLSKCISQTRNDLQSA